jgi:hypothetical protein
MFTPDVPFIARLIIIIDGSIKKVAETSYAAAAEAAAGMSGVPQPRASPLAQSLSTSDPFEAHSPRRPKTFIILSEILC